MADDAQRESAELEAIAGTYARMARLIEENEELWARTRTAEHQSDLATQECDLLRGQLDTTKRERDRYFREFSALGAQLESVGAGLLNAVKTARSALYGNDRAPPAREWEPAPRGAPELEEVPPVPAFLTKPRDHAEASEPPPINLAALARAIGDTPRS
jgi:hypothetical protein